MPQIFFVQQKSGGAMAHPDGGDNEDDAVSDDGDYDEDLDDHRDDLFIYWHISDVNESC